VLVKGAHDSADELASADLVRSWGGAVVLVDALPVQPQGATVTRLRG